MKLAIIGAAEGQLPLCKKAKQLGVYTICFAWEEGAVCKDYVDKFYPISILEKEKIAEICKQEGIQGVVSNASEITAEIVSYIATELNLHGNDYEMLCKIKNKYYVREKTKDINDLSKVLSCRYMANLDVKYPCIVKPQVGSAKKGVVFVKDEEHLEEAVQYAKEGGADIIIEDYIDGREVSVESISYEGRHFVLQITDKENSGAPHFVELSHHQPSDISSIAKKKIERVIPQILDCIGFKNGASHIEMRIDSDDNIYLIEVNPRGGGDEISRILVELSTGYDYIKGMIEVALGVFKEPILSHEKYAGIYFLCQQRAERLPYFERNEKPAWLIEKKYDVSEGLFEATGNYNRNGYLIYQSDKKIELN